MSGLGRVLRRAWRDRRLSPHVVDHVRWRLESLRGGDPEAEPAAPTPAIAQVVANLIVDLRSEDVDAFLVDVGDVAGEIGIADEDRAEARAILAAVLDDWALARGRGAWTLSHPTLPSLRITLSFWQANGLGERELVGERGGERFDASLPYGDIELGGRIVPTHPLRPSAPPMGTVEFPIDAVISWVSSADVDWMQAWRRAWAEHGHSPEENGIGRFGDGAELRYLMRSLDAHAGFFRRIHVVSACAPPEWLVLDDRVRWVDQATVLGHDQPIFNSLAVEAALHRIPDLAEHFVYFNDDMFVARPIDRRVFFEANGIARFYEDARLGAGVGEPGDSSFDGPAKNARNLIAERFGWAPERALRHAPYALRRDACQAATDWFGEPLAATRRSTFRSHENVTSTSGLFHWVGYELGLALTGDPATRQITITSRWAPSSYAALERRRDVDFVCCNDDPSADPAEQERARRRMLDFLAEFFPQPSSAER